MATFVRTGFVKSRRIRMADTTQYWNFGFRTPNSTSSLAKEQRRADLAGVSSHYTRSQTKTNCEWPSAMVQSQAKSMEMGMFFVPHAIAQPSTTASGEKKTPACVPGKRGRNDKVSFVACRVAGWLFPGRQSASQPRRLTFGLPRRRCPSLWPEKAGTGIEPVFSRWL